MHAANRVTLAVAANGRLPANRLGWTERSDGEWRRREHVIRDIHVFSCQFNKASPVVFLYLHQSHFQTAGNGLCVIPTIFFSCFFGRIPSELG